MKDYNKGDEVDVLINNPRNNNKDEWRSAKVVEKRTIYSYGSSRHTPYDVLIVEVIRTYYRKIKDIYNGIVWIGEEHEFYDKLNTEMVIYYNQVRVKE